jgi:hypothetical protein
MTRETLTLVGESHHLERALIRLGRVRSYSSGRMLATLRQSRVEIALGGWPAGGRAINSRTPLSTREKTILGAA